jgi:leucyl aminopeptidase
VALAGEGVVTPQHAVRWQRPPPMRPIFTATPSPAPLPASALAKFTLVCGKAEARDVQRGPRAWRRHRRRVMLAKTLANRPANHCTPTYLAEQAKSLGKSHGLKVEVLDRKQLEKLGMGSFLAVSQGSAEPPKFIVARYDGRGQDAGTRRPRRARASPSTPAASRSSPRPRWTR